jgi:apolipoprotein N-acyltransferase
MLNFIYTKLLLPVLLSFFIYSSYFEILNYQFLFTITALASYFLFFKLNKKDLFYSGFLVGILWFWWIGLSFKYYDLSYLIPIVIVGIGLVYGGIFYLVGISNHLFYRAIAIIAISFIEPFGFGWFKLELPLIDSYINSDKISFIFLIVLSFISVKFYNKSKKISILFYISAIGCLIYNHTYSVTDIAPIKLKIYKYNTNIPQDKKWDNNYKDNILKENLNQINYAISKDYDLIIFPETAFPLVLNKQEYLIYELKQKSKHISIILGSLYQKDGLYYNSAFLFQNNSMKVAHKVVLVPFGEAVPLPEKIRDFINNTFYNGASDYETAKKPTTFNVKDEKFRMAICYEGTTDTIYQNLDTNNAIIISNNGWFMPSIEPVLQNKLIKYYKNKYKLNVISVDNIP